MTGMTDSGGVARYKLRRVVHTQGDDELAATTDPGKRDVYWQEWFTWWPSRTLLFGFPKRLARPDEAAPNEVRVGQLDA